MLTALDAKIAWATTLEMLQKRDTDCDDFMKRHPLVILKWRFLRHIQQVPVVGFISGRYDLNLIKVHLHTFFSTKEESECFSVIKRSNQYLAVYTKHTVFLDVVNYLAPGYNYQNYLLAFTKNECKKHFPYSWMTSVRKLENTTLPPRSAFYNKLTGCHISQADYESCEKVWRNQKMRRLRDLPSLLQQQRRGTVWRSSQQPQTFLQRARHRHVQRRHLPSRFNTVVPFPEQRHPLRPVRPS